jgi:hypothetical protein
MPAKFKDLNFKLAVIEQLMYRKKLIQPAFDVHAYLKETKKKFNPKMKAFTPVPGTRKIFRDLEIPQELLDQLDVIDQNYHTVYHHIIPYWDGEGDEFNITSTADLKLVPNLKKIVLLYDQGEKMAAEFRAKGIEASYL